MAAGLGFKEFAVGDILTAADANGYLASQTVMVFASSAARASAITSPQEGMFSYLKDTNATEFYTGSAWTAVGGGGKVLQVVNAVYSTATTITSASYTDTGLSASITPSSATSKVLVFVSQQIYTDRGVGQCGAGAQLLRGATVIVNPGTAANSILLAASGAASTAAAGYYSTTYLDSPATTSATTYKVQAKPETTANSSQVIAQLDSARSTITLMEIGA
jgi:hypothetical protein